jgi:type II secretion system protein L
VPRAIGLTVGSEWVRATEVGGYGRRLRKLRHWAMPCADPEERHQALCRLAREAGREVLWVLGMPGDRVAQRHLVLPFRSTRHLAGGLPYLLEEHVPDEVERLAVSHMVMGRGPGTQVLVFAVPAEDLAELLRTVQAAGIDPQQVVPTDLAAWYFHGEQWRDEWVLDGQASPPVLLAFQEGYPVVRHVLSPGEGKPLECRRALLGMTERVGARPERLVVVSGELPQDAVLEQLAIPWTQPRVPAPDGPPSSDLKYELETALACAALVPGPAGRVNLRVGPLAYQGYARRHRARVATAFALLFLCLLAWVGQLAVHYQQLQGQMRSYRQQTLALFQEVLPKAKPVDVVRQMQQRLEQVQAASARTGADRSLVKVLLALLEPGPAHLLVQELSYDASRLSIQGEVASPLVLEQWRRSLESSGGFTAVSLGPTPAVKTGERARFSLSVQLRGVSRP